MSDDLVRIDRKEALASAVFTINKDKPKELTRYEGRMKEIKNLLKVYSPAQVLEIMAPFHNTTPPGHDLSGKIDKRTEIRNLINLIVAKSKKRKDK